MTSEQIKQWLALVADARLAVAKATYHADQVPGVDDWELRQAGEYLTQQFLTGLDAHGKALLAEHLGETPAHVA